MALDRLDLDVSPGEFITLLGPSGSGKSTLLMLLTGLLEPDEGTIRIGDQDATRIPSRQRGIGVVFQNYALFPHLTVYENIAFPLEMRKQPSATIEHNVERALSLVRLQGFGNRLPTELSGGQQQRVALARALVFEPSLILMDEPLGALDKRLRDEMQFEIKRLHGLLGATMVYVTHDQEEALSMSDRICLMNQGRIEQIGTPQEMYLNPRTVFAANFLGESNFFRGTVEAVDAGRVSVRIGELDGAPNSISGISEEAVSVGAKVACMVRPESLHVATKQGSIGNSLRATVESVMLIGALTRMRCRVGEQSISLVSLTNANARMPEMSAEIDLIWSSDSTVVLPDDGRLP